VPNVIQLSLLRPYRDGLLRCCDTTSPVILLPFGP